MMAELRRAHAGVDADEQHAHGRPNHVTQQRQTDPTHVTHATYLTYTTYLPARICLPTWFTCSSRRRMFSPRMFFTSDSL